MSTVPLECLIWTFVVTAVVFFFAGFAICAKRWRDHGDRNARYRLPESMIEVESGGKFYSVKLVGVVGHGGVFVPTGDQK